MLLGAALAVGVAGLATAGPAVASGLATTEAEEAPIETVDAEEAAEAVDEVPLDGECFADFELSDEDIAVNNRMTQAEIDLLGAEGFEIETETDDDGLLYWYVESLDDATFDELEVVLEGLYEDSFSGHDVPEVISELELAELQEIEEAFAARLDEAGISYDWVTEDEFRFVELDGSMSDEDAAVAEGIFEEVFGDESDLCLDDLADGDLFGDDSDWCEDGHVEDEEG